MAIEQFELLKKSAVTQIQSDLQSAVAASATTATNAASSATTSATNAATSATNAASSATSAASSATSASTSATAASTSANSFPTTHPEVNYVARVSSPPELGIIKDLEELTKMYLEDLQLDKSSLFKWSCYSGVQVRTQEQNTYVIKAYDNGNTTQVIGPNLVLNGSFASDVSWAKGTGWSISGGVASFAPTGSYSNLSQPVLTIDKTYVITITVTRTAGVLYIKAGSTGDVFPISASGTYTSYSKCSGDTLALIQADNTFAGTVDNVSFAELTYVNGSNDAVQLANVNQPYLSPSIAPNEIARIKNISDNNYLPHTEIGLSSIGNNSFTITTVLKPYFQKIGNASNKGRYFRGSIIPLITNAGSVVLHNNTTGSLSSATNILKEGIIIVTWAANSVGISLWINGKQYPYNGTYTPFNGNVQGLLDLGSDDTFAGEIFHHQIFNRALSASEIQSNHSLLQLRYPEQGVAIGNQFWYTSNEEVVVASDGTAIGEYQYTAANSPEMVVNGTFDADASWTKEAGWTISGGTAIATSAANDFTIYQSVGATIGKVYKIVYTISSITSGGLKATLGSTSLSTTRTTANTYTEYVVAQSASLQIRAVGTTSAVIDNVSIKEVGWDEAQLVYDYVYGATSGTAAVKDLAGIKAATMWCYYNNDPLHGAVYGKLYNWWAAKLLSLFPIKGSRIPSIGDATQLSSFLGGDSVSGKKIKARYGGFDNEFATNESGFTMLDGGFRNPDGTFAGATAFSRIWLSTDPGTSSANRIAVTKADTLLLTNDVGKGFGYSIRRMRNEPVGNSVEAISSDKITSDIASTAQQIPIKFGYTVRQIRVTADTALTNIEAKLHNTAGTAIATLMTGKSVSAGETMTFKIVADHTAMLQDGTVRITATGNTSVSIGCEVVVLAEKATLI
jgi:uncharacterized protein (TIGR02145 family)